MKRKEKEGKNKSHESCMEWWGGIHVTLTSESSQQVAVTTQTLTIVSTSPGRLAGAFNTGWGPYGVEWPGIEVKARAVTFFPPTSTGKKNICKDPGLLTDENRSPNHWSYSSTDMLTIFPRQNSTAAAMSGLCNSHSRKPSNTRKNLYALCCRLSTWKFSPTNFRSVFAGGGGNNVHSTRSH